VDGKMRFACVDGPEFDGHLVDFDGLENRLHGYLPEERKSRERFTHEDECRLEETAPPGS